MVDVVVTRWESERSVHEWAVGGPGTGSASMVRGYVGYEEWPAAPMVRREMARNGLALILAFGDPLDVWSATDGQARSLRAFVVGNQSRSSLTRLQGHQSGVQVELTGAGALSLFGQVGELNGTAVPIDEVLGRWGNNLVEQLGNASGWEERFVILDRALACWKTRSELCPEVAWLKRQLVASGGRARVEPLMDETGWSRRVVTERFRRQVGVSPKAYARVLRFRRAVALLGAGRERALADVAIACGFYDQSHFTREFVALAGCTPTEYRAEAAGVPEVSFVQDDDLAIHLP